MTRRLLPLVFAVIVASCAGGGATPTPPAAPSGGSRGVASAAPVSAAAEQPISASGPAGWDRGPYDLAGGAYRLAWESDGTCSALYFGIVGVRNGFKESPPTAGDVALADLLKGDRTIVDVPVGRYYFNVSGVACKKYAATLTRVR